MLIDSENIIVKKYKDIEVMKLWFLEHEMAVFWTEIYDTLCSFLQVFCVMSLHL